MLETTSHSHFLTPKTSCGILIFRSSFTLTWQANLHFSFCSFRVKNPVSVGRMEPPPSSIWQRHMPQVPPPPHAEGSRILLLLRVVRSVFPGSVTISRSPSFMFIFTSPDGVSFFLAKSKIATSRTITPRNTATLAITTVVCVESKSIENVFLFYNLIPMKPIKANPIRPVTINVMPNPRNGAGTFEY